MALNRFYRLRRKGWKTWKISRSFIMGKFQPKRRDLFFASVSKSKRKPRPAYPPESLAWRKIWKLWS
jgi:hypothetical protein